VSGAHQFARAHCGGTHNSPPFVRLRRVCQAWAMCPSCRKRKARRHCPALGYAICAVCCATKRQVEIQCPSSCGYLSSAREHPAAVVRKRQIEDVTRLLPTIRHLTERQYQLFFLFHTAIARFKPEGFSRLVDEDVAEAAAAIAATLETSARGVIYEHSPSGLPAQKLAAELRQMLNDIRAEGAKVHDHEALVVLRAIEAGARQTTGSTADSATGTAYVDLLSRLLEARGQAPGPAPAGATGSGLIVP
jgi:hypothetical protein